MVCLLSWNIIRRMEVLQNSFPHRLKPLDNQAFQIDSSPRKDSIESLTLEFQDVFNEDAITPMKGDPMHIHLNRNTPGYKPLKVFTARSTPLHFKQQASKLISQLEASGVIVPPNENVEWCCPGFFVPKPN